MRLPAYTLVLAAVAVSSSASRAERELAEEDSIRITLTATNQDLVSRMKTFLDTMTATNEELISQRNALNTVVKGLEEARKTAEENRDLINSMFQLHFGDSEDTTVREFQGKLYVHVAKQVNFTEAEVWCKQHGMELATITNSDENEFIRKLARDNKPTTLPMDGYSYPWIGLRKEGGQWRWRNSAALTIEHSLTYTNWRPTEPNGSGDCVVVDIFDGYNGGWYDRPCSDDRSGDPFVCSK